jgi:mRNA interferase RelE/StbE
MAMKYTVEISGRAKKSIKALPQKAKDAIGKKIDALADDPRPPGAEKMKGEFKGHYRIRAGDYRIIYTIEEQVLVVLVIRVGHRKDIYKS